MNFLNFLTSGANLFNFNLQNLTSAITSVSSPENKNTLPHSPQLENLSSQNSAEVSEEVKLLNQQQLLINQYMHMNIQLLNHKLECLEKKPAEEKAPKIEREEDDQTNKESKKKSKKIIKCGHESKPHYAKGLCNNCYHKFGRNKKPWKCSHEKLYAGGMCQNCYINNYNKKKRENRVKQEEISEMEMIGQLDQVKNEENREEEQ